MEFRLLRSDEIQCRIGTINEKGLSLLLYKDARCDMTILDETVGSMNWQRSHSRENANCTVSIWDETKKQWISKEDTGTESNTEAEKGLASDSFKRACTNWGIGRELYTAPFIWIPASKCTIKDGRRCYDKFEVMLIEYTPDRKISKLVIGNTTRQQVVFPSDGKPAEKPSEKPSEPDKEAMKFRCEECGKELKPYLDENGRTVSVRRIAETTKAKFGKCLCPDCAVKA